MEVRIRGFGVDEYLRFGGVLVTLVSVLMPYVEFAAEGPVTLFELMGMSEALRYPGLSMIVTLLLIVLGAGVVVAVFTKVGGYLLAVGLLYFDLVVVLGIGMRPGLDPVFGSGFYLAALGALTVIVSDGVASVLEA